MPPGGYQWAYIFSAVRPDTGDDVIRTPVMDLFLARRHQRHLGYTDRPICAYPWIMKVIS